MVEEKEIFPRLCLEWWISKIGWGFERDKINGIR